MFDILEMLSKRSQGQGRTAWGGVSHYVIASVVFVVSVMLFLLLLE